MIFSILIAHYNNWDYFQECYQSINNQTFKNFEIIIVDDCSTDDSFQKLVNLSQSDLRIKLFRNTENKKVGFTKRRCIEVASGEICGFLDPDDLLSSTALEEVVAVYQLETKCIATYSKIKLIDKDSNEIGDFKFSKKIKNGLKTFFNVNFEVAHFFTFKKEVYNKTTGIDTFIKRAEDKDIYMKMCEIAEVKLIDNPQYLYRIHSGGVSNNKNSEKALFWHWVALIKMAERRNINIEDLFIEHYIPKNKYLQLESKINSLKNSRLLKLLSKLGIFKAYKYL